MQQIQDSLAQIQGSLGKAQLVATMDVIDTAGFHDMDEDLQTTSEINPRYLGVVRRVRQAVVAATWPEELREEVDAFQAALREFEAALDANDLASAAFTTPPRARVMTVASK